MKAIKIKALFYRTLFVLLSSTIMVFFSEKSFWYVQGYAIVELVLYYAVPVSVCLWIMDIFKVQRLSGVVLVGALFGFLVEGVLTPVIYEAGLLDPVMPAYFIGWHGLLSFVFGWYLLRKWLIESYPRRLLIAGSAFGIFWGLWSLPYRLPESIQDFQVLVKLGENFLPGVWPVGDFLFYTLVFTLMLMFSHWLLGNGIWQSKFKLNNWEKGLLLILIIILFGYQVFPVVPLAILKLITLIALVLFPLGINRLQRDEDGVLISLDRRLRFSQTLPLLLIPVFATIVYGLAALIPPSVGLLRMIYTSFATIQGVIGGGFFIWAWVDSVRRIS